VNDGRSRFTDKGIYLVEGSVNVLDARAMSMRSATRSPSAAPATRRTWQTS